MLNWKRIGAMLCASLVMTTCVQNAWGDDSVQVSCEVVNDTVTISGTVAQPGTRPVGIVVVKPGMTLSNITPGTAGTVIDQSADVESEADGTFSMRYVVDGTKGTYQVYITTPESVRPITTTFDYCNPSEILSAVNPADSGNIEAVLMEYAKYIGIELAGDSLYGGLTAKQSVLSVMEQTEFQSPAEMKSTFRWQVVQAALSEATNSSITKAMAELTAIIDPALQTEYEAIAAAYKKNVEKTMLAGKPYNSKENVVAQLKQGMMLARIKQAGYPDNLALLQQLGGTVDLNGPYKNLSVTKQADVLKAIAQRDFDTYNDLSRFFDDKVSELAQGGSIYNPGSGRGNGASGSGKLLPVQMEVNTTNPYIQPQQGDDAFADLGEAEWARESITELSKRGIVSGVGDGKFEPNRPVTREEFVKMLVSAVDAVDSAPANYTDVNTAAWYYRYIAIASANGLVSGYPDGRFGVGEAISRQDVAVMLLRTARMFGYPLTAMNDRIDFMDDTEIAEYAKEAVYTMQGAGLMNGTDGARFEPQASATRAMVAKVLHGLICAK